MQNYTNKTAASNTLVRELYLRCYALSWTPQKKMPVNVSSNQDINSWKH